MSCSSTCIKGIKIKLEMPRPISLLAQFSAFFAFILKSQIPALFFKKTLMVEFRHSDRHTANLQGA
jgi:hypothetical protein